MWDNSCSRSVANTSNHKSLSTHLFIEIQRSFKVLEAGVDHAPVVIVAEEVFGIVGSVLLADVHHVQLQVGDGWLEALR